MYNLERKQSFLYDLPKSTIKRFTKLFSVSAAIEESCDCDLCMLSGASLQTIVNSYSGVKASSTKMVVDDIKRYLDWCINRGFEVSNNIDYVDTSMAQQIRNQMFATPLQLQIELNKAFDSEDLDTVDCIYKAFVWLVFSGIPVNEVTAVECSHLDLAELTIRKNGKQYDIYKESVKCFRKAMSLTEFNYIHPKYGTRVKKRSEGRELMRGTKGVVKQKAALDYINKCLRRSGCHSSVNKIYLSGLFYRMYERERSGIPVDFADIIVQRFEAKEHVFKTITENAALNRATERMIEDYNNWKDAFR